MRNPSGAVPTDTARTIAAALTAGFGAISSALAELRRSGPDNRLSISMSLGIGEYWLTPRLSEFYTICDQFDLRIDTTHRLVDLQSEEFDFVIRFGPPPDESLDSIFLFGGCVVPTDLFILRGTPEFIRSDNGPEFVAQRVRDWIAAVGAKTAFIEPGSPWENGYCESFNARFRDELLNGEIFYSLREAQIIIEQWRRHYNTVRPHSALGYRPPAPEIIIPMDQTPIMH